MYDNWDFKKTISFLELKIKESYKNTNYFCKYLNFDVLQLINIYEQKNYSPLFIY